MNARLAPTLDSNRQGILYRRNTPIHTVGQGAGTRLIRRRRDLRLRFVWLNATQGVRHNRETRFVTKNIIGVLRSVKGWCEILPLAKNHGGAQFRTVTLGPRNVGPSMASGRLLEPNFSVSVQ